ncbi:hypothetical protein ACLVWU_12455 [Bdellovibrio sp. HCB290]|uniref:hypothetical protein n=1 Tax=Bdellovibrio sp. HCB290 TaxID=3394356 RepID=UPI0039B56EB2
MFFKTIQKNTLTVDTYSFTFLHEISEVLETNDGYLVLLKYWVRAKSGYNLWDNVYMLNKKLELTWQIKGTKSRCYVGIFHYDGDYRAVDLDGVSSVLDMTDGKVIQEDFLK